MIRSLRLRLLIGTLLTTVIILGLFSWGIYFFMHRALQAQFDDELLTQARALASMTEIDNGRIQFEFDAQEMPQFQTPQHPEYFQIWIDGEGVLSRSDSLKGADLPRPRNPASYEFSDAILPDGRHGRWVNLCFSPLPEDSITTNPSPVTGVITVARGMYPIGETLENMRGLLLGLCAAASVLCAGVLMIVVTSALRSIRRLARQLETLRETDLSYRFDPAGIPAEIAPMVDRLNGLLERVDAAFGRERGFTADVAHELRTPLAGLRTTLEVCRSRPRDSATYEAAIDKCASIVDRMQEMTQRLLLLARADSRQLTVQSETFDLRELLEDSWSQFRTRAQTRGLSMQWGALKPNLIRADPELLRIVIDNLFDNAVSYADSGGTLTVATNVDDRSVEFFLSNTGSQVDAKDVPKIYDRFWRGDQSRSNNGAHCGLGLSLCQRLVKILDGDLHIDTDRGALFIVRLRLPAAPIT
jgi:two-component system heavy metal sensor histidine kinase CusS